MRTSNVSTGLKRGGCWHGKVSVVASESTEEALRERSKAPRAQNSLTSVDAQMETNIFRNSYVFGKRLLFLGFVDSNSK